jgi:hypothetical protein
VESIEDVKSVDDAGKVIDKAGGVDWVVWSAGMLLYIIMTHVKMQFH